MIQGLLVPCGAPRNFWDRNAIPSDIAQMMERDVIQPDGCNRCADPDKRPIWLAPGDLCTLKNDRQLLEDYPDLNCDVYGGKYDKYWHVKACVTSREVDELWETGHCHVDGTGPDTGIAPYFPEMHEGLLFCQIYGA